MFSAFADLPFVSGHDVWVKACFQLPCASRPRTLLLSSRRTMFACMHTHKQDERLRVFGDAWECTYDGELTLQPVCVTRTGPTVLS